MLLFLILVKNLIIITIIFSSPRFQSLLTKSTIDFFANRYEINITIDNVYLKFPDKLILSGVYIEDQKGDTLLYAWQFYTRMSKIQYFNKKLYIDKINIVDPQINVCIDSTGVANFAFILEKFAEPEKDPDEVPKEFAFDIFCNNFNLKNAVFNYKNEGIIPQDSIFDASNISIKDFNVLISNFEYHHDSIKFDIAKFTLSERSGFKLKEISSNIKIFDLGIELRNFIIETNRSKITCSEIILAGTEEDYLSDPLNKLNVQLTVDSSYFNFSDLKFFMPEYRNINEELVFSGHFNGNISRLRLRNFDLNFGNDTRLSANLSIDGLPDLDRSFIFGDINYLYTSSKDIERITKVISPEKKPHLPGFVYELGNITFAGNLVGMVNDVVAYGKFNTNIGEIRTDLGMVSDFKNGLFKFKGELSAKDINLAKVTGNEDFGLLSLNAMVNGEIDTLANFNSYINCDIKSIFYKNYNYQNIVFDGNASNNFYEGSLNINDPNLSFYLDGYYDYKENVPSIKLYADGWANLSNLQFVNDMIDIDIEAELTGDLIRMPEGHIIFNDLYYKQQQDSVKFDKLSIHSYYDNEMFQHLTLRSDFIDADFYGKYYFDELINSLSTLVYNYLPSLSPEDTDIIAHEDNRANFNIKFYNIDEITGIFIPRLKLENTVTIYGSLNTRNNRIEANINTPVIQYDSVYIMQNSIELKTYHDSIDLSIKAGKVFAPNLTFFENLDVSINVFNDSVYYTLNWDNFDDSIKNNGNISLYSVFIARDNNEFPLIRSKIFESEMYIQNRFWEISETPIIIDTSNINISNFRLTHDKQSLYINGDISKNPAKRLSYSVSNVDVAHINSYIYGSGYSFEGILSGSGRIASLYSKPSFRTTFSIDDFKINNEDFGRFEISGTYDATTGAFVTDGNNKYMRIRGNYVPETDSINLSFNVENFNLEIMEPYLNNHNLSNFSGNFNINLNIEGILKDPQINGYISFNQARFTYDFLKLSVVTNDRVKITKSSIVFDNFKVYDEQNNLGTINGAMHHDKFKDIKLDFVANVSNMKVLSTNALDNQMYYGTVFADGTFRIRGTPQNYGMDVEAVTKPRTRFVLPMTSVYDTREIEFITFVKPSRYDDTLQILDPIRHRGEYYFRMDVEVTPDAEAQIVFDPQVGDLIRGNCRGNINIEYTSDRQFYMYGELVVVEGDYLFTLQNVINKRFHIKPGGTINWEGEPNEAKIDINAVYNLRAPLIDLMRAYADTSDVYRRPTSVECHMFMSGNIMNPEIRFNIKAPNADEKAQAQLANLSQDEINRQLLYLLILNRFHSPADMRVDQTSTTDAFGVTSSELLSNQLSNWLSQISRDFDIGFNYRPGTDVSGQELEVALSTQILDDRVLINGNVGYGEQLTHTPNAFIGDVEVQVKLNPKGNLRVKGFTQVNDELNADLGPYTSGLGIFYTQDFNSFTELAKRFYNAVTFANRRKDKEESVD